MNSEWQDIETAPKDGSWIVLISTWNRYFKAVMQWDDGGWRDWEEREHDIHSYATHWMPLSQPPSTTGESEKKKP